VTAKYTINFQQNCANTSHYVDDHRGWAVNADLHVKQEWNKESGNWFKVLWRFILVIKFLFY